MESRFVSLALRIKSAIIDWFSDRMCPLQSLQTAPVFTIPPELLSDIFLLSRHFERLDASIGDPTQSCDFPTSASFFSSFSIRASHVCLAWRRVALATAALWTSIRILPSTPHALVQAHLARSSAALLEVYVDLDSAWYWRSASLANVKLALTSVQSQSIRLQRLILHCARQDAPVPAVINLLCTQPTPNLRELFIRLEHIQGGDLATANVDPTHPTIFEKGVPALYHLHLQGLAVHMFRPPMQTLTVLELVQSASLPMSYMALRTLLMLPLGLKHLVLWGEVVSSQSMSVLSPLPLISLPSLESLWLSGSPGSDRAFTAILTHAIAPRLTALVLRDIQEVDLDRDFNSTGFPNLETLMFIDFDISEVAYPTLFRAFPNLESFISAHSTVNMSMSTRALLKHDGGVPWPKLRRLTYAFNDEEDSSVKELIAGRHSMHSPLEELRFITKDEEALSSWLEWLEEADMPLEHIGTSFGYMGCHLKSWSQTDDRWPLPAIPLD